MSTIIKDTTLHENGWPSSTIPSVEQFLSQSWIHEHRYELSKNIATPEVINTLNLGAMSTIGLNPYNFRTYTKNGKNVDLCEWLIDHTICEAHYYDYIVPAGYVTPVSFFNTQRWNMLLLSFDPYDSRLRQDRIFTNPKFITRCYTEKDEPYMPKSFLLELVEIGWLGYDNLEDCVFVHHIQMRGGLKEWMNYNDRVWFYRFLIRMFAQLLPQSRLPQLFVPDATTFQLLTERQSKYTRACMQPYTKHVLKKSDFHKVDYQEFAETCPVAASQCRLLEYLQPNEIQLWRYDYADPHTLANSTSY